MSSKICKSLYFAGEVLDVDADTGGYNLQIAFSTARLAAENAVKIFDFYYIANLYSLLLT